MRCPRIGVTFESAEKLDIIANSLALLDASIIPLAAGETSVHQLAVSIDGLLLAGGSDIEPSLYGQTRHVLSSPACCARDFLELALVAKAEARGTPVLGVCRGMQLLNIFFRGTLTQHIPHPECHGPIFVAEPICVVHPVTFSPYSRFFAITASRAVVVNSRHHQAVNRVGDGLIVAGTAPDGTVEAIERPSHPYMLGVQWHLEDRVRSSGADRLILESFVDAASARKHLAA